jgi:transcriptional regulator with XRE-family HTH domain
MRRKPHERLRELREKKGFKTQKQFCATARRYGYSLNPRRYGGIERGDIVPTQNDIITICKAMTISADAWLLGFQDRIDTKLLDDAEAQIVKDLVMGLLSLR